MYYTGFADEAAVDIDNQIKATKELGWEYIESRNINGKNIHDISDEDFEIVAGKLEDAGVKVNCFGSRVANWGKHPLKEEDFQLCIEELNRAIPRMQRLGTKMLRGMSFAIEKERAPDDIEVEKNVIEKLKKLTGICADAGIDYMHENCMNFGGQSPQHSLKLVEGVDMSNFKLLYDTGNPPMTDLRLGSVPYKKQNSWDFYKSIKEHIAYVHIKDAVFKKETGGAFPEAEFTYPGEGDGDVRRIVKDLLDTGYDGGFSMEPHLQVVFHEAEGESKEDAMYKSYVEYGRRFMKIVEECRS